MKTVIDWDNAPEGATYCDTIPAVFVWLKATSEKTMYWRFKEWVDCDYEDLSATGIIERPKAEAKPIYLQSMYDGNIPPTVGMECQTSTGIVELLLPIDESGTGVVKIEGEYSIICISALFPITPPIELIDGEAYQFLNRKGEILCGIYNKERNILTVEQGMYFDIIAVTHIKPLTLNT